MEEEKDEGEEEKSIGVFVLLFSSSPFPLSLLRYLLREDEGQKFSMLVSSTRNIFFLSPVNKQLRLFTMRKRM